MSVQYERYMITLYKVPNRAGLMGGYNAYAHFCYIGDSMGIMLTVGVPRDVCAALCLRLWNAWVEGFAFICNSANPVCGGHARTWAMNKNKQPLDRIATGYVGCIHILREMLALFHWQQQSIPSTGVAVCPWSADKEDRWYLNWDSCVKALKDESRLIVLEAIETLEIAYRLRMCRKLLCDKLDPDIADRIEHLVYANPATHN